jgi:hypothetical protein
MKYLSKFVIPFVNYLMTFHYVITPLRIYILNFMQHVLCYCRLTTYTYDIRVGSKLIIN